MLQYFVYLIFILSVALAAGGVVLSSKLRNRYHHAIFSTLLYFQAELWNTTVSLHSRTVKGSVI